MYHNIYGNEPLETVECKTVLLRLDYQGVNIHIITNNSDTSCAITLI